jgi:hypothetical protein
MTDTVSEIPALGGRFSRLNDDQKSLLIAAAAVVVLAVAALLYFSRGSESPALAQVTNDARGQLVTQDVSCHTLHFSVKTLTKQQVYYCNASHVAQPNRPNGHIHESSFTRCYVVAVNGQTVDVSHAIAVEAKLRHKTIPCR